MLTLKKLHVTNLMLYFCLLLTNATFGATTLIPVTITAVDKNIVVNTASLNGSNVKIGITTTGDSTTYMPDKTLTFSQTMPLKLPFDQVANADIIGSLNGISIIGLNKKINRITFSITDEGPNSAPDCASSLDDPNCRRLAVAINVYDVSNSVEYSRPLARYNVEVLSDDYENISLALTIGDVVDKKFLPVKIGIVSLLSAESTWLKYYYRTITLVVNK